MATFDPTIAPWLAASSCVGFTILFVGSLYVFPVETAKSKLAKQVREHARYTATAAAAAGTTTQPLVHNHHTTTPPASPRPSSSSAISTHSNATTTSASNAFVITTTKAPSTADNRAHRSSTHLHFIDTTSSAANPRLSSSPATSSSSTFSVSSASSSSSASVSTPPSSSSASAISTATITAKTGGSSLSAKPEVAIHPHSYSQYDQESARFQSPVENQKLDRNHPLVIKQRFKGIALTCFVVPFYLWWLFTFSGAISTDQSFWERLGRFLGLLGISIPNNIFKLVNHVVLPLLLVGCLFMGPTLMMFLSNELPFQQAFDWTTQRQHIQGLMGMRNFVVGPISEEFIFRACMVAIVANSGARLPLMIFVLPLVFGIAHINHAYESYVKKGRTRQALMGAAAMAVFQLLYTTLFGWFAAFLFLRTSNLIGPCLCHSFCNMMGFPDVTNIQYFGRWKKWLYLTFVLGMVLFGLLLRPLTQPGWYGDEESSAYWSLTMGAPAPHDS
ncbi:CAAX prenyl protease [Mortierella hygrophila]|uniref:intramembrane prenyl-peptidase Rce1 n=1 Tax=Mortierella hygrophila TaxID=979708 RepID=A0A9P6K0Q0_9FUNG|nr:CAAX prenyl protease [Mortierella hygrophila]